MKTIVTLIAAAAATLITGSVFAADSSDRTSMPNNCSDRNANCVIQDGPPRNRRGGETGTTTQPTGPTSSNTGSGSGSKSGESKSGNSSSR